MWFPKTRRTYRTSMSSKRKMILSVRIFFALAVLVVGLGVALYFYLPHYLESRIIPQFFAEAGIADFEFKIRRIGILGADLSDLRIGSEQNPALLIRSAQIDFSLKTLYRKEIERIALGGIELYGEFNNGKFSCAASILMKY